MTLALSMILNYHQSSLIRPVSMKMPMSHELENTIHLAMATRDHIEHIPTHNTLLTASREFGEQLKNPNLGLHDRVEAQEKFESLSPLIFALHLKLQVYQTAIVELKSHAVLVDPAEYAESHPSCSEFYNSLPEEHKMNFLKFIIASAKRVNYNVKDEATVHYFMNKFDDSNPESKMPLVDLYNRLQANSASSLEAHVDLMQAAHAIVPEENIRAFQPLKRGCSFEALINPDAEVIEPEAS